MKIALAQLNYTIGAVQGNKVKIIDAIHKAKEQGADLAVFAEFAISGVQCYDLFYQKSFMEECEAALAEIASRCEGISVLVGLPMYDNDGKPISAAAYIENRLIKKYIGKSYIRERSELPYLSSSDGCENLRIGGRNFIVSISEDPRRLLEEMTRNTEIIINMSAVAYRRDILLELYDFLSEFTFRSRRAFVTVNNVGGQADVVYCGFSAAYNKDGQPVALLKSFQEDFRIVDVDEDREVEFPVQDRMENVYNAIKLGLGDFFSKRGFKKACLGFSGGIDSAVVLAMAVETLGAENVRVLMMPSEFSSDHSVSDSIEMAGNLGVEYDVIPITESYKAVLESMKPVIGGTSFSVAEENIQARIRCVMLMALSNKMGHILLNTSNKSEAAMGYGTLYGDMAGSISILGDLYKTEVYDLARYINKAVPVIPNNIIVKEPSAELRPDQKDTDSLPPYEVLDAILYRKVEENQSIEEIISAGFDDELVHFVVEGIKKSEYKRRQSSPSLRMSKMPFGSVLVLPMLHKYVL